MYETAKVFVLKKASSGLYFIETKTGMRMTSDFAAGSDNAAEAWAKAWASSWVNIQIECEFKNES